MQLGAIHSNANLTLAQLHTCTINAMGDKRHCISDHPCLRDLLRQHEKLFQGTSRCPRVFDVAQGPKPDCNFMLAILKQARNDGFAT